MHGQVSEWSKEHDWKSCVRQKRTEGSNPSLSVENPASYSTCGIFSIFLTLNELFCLPNENETGRITRPP